MIADEAEDKSVEDRAQRHPGESDLRAAFEAKLARIARFFADGSTPGPGGAFMEWFAWARVQAEPAACC